MTQTEITITGAREHNLKNVSLSLPKNKLIVFTGLSGSGKSSLAFDTLYAEGQRRYVESLSSYARQFLGVMHNPMWTKLMVYRQQLLLTKKHTLITHAQLLAPLPKFMTTCDSYLPESATPLSQLWQRNRHPKH
jgi:alpha-D-ribose 1-methylphosphonate 5-triphosphate synthase subunit PhnL